MRIRALNHSTYQHLYHVIWGTKYRRHFLKPDVVQKRLADSVYETVRLHPELYIFKLKTDLDHVHIQIEIAPSISVASAIGSIKARSSIALKNHFQFISRMYLDGGIWSVGYYSSTNGLNEETIRRYIENQGRRDYSADAQKELGFS